jgi:hypothetical protein
MDVIISQDQQNRLVNILINIIKTNGLNHASKLSGSYQNLFKMLDVKTPMEFLHLFDDLDVVESEKDSDFTLFRYKVGYNVMIISEEFGVKHVLINYDEIWSVLRNHFKLKDMEVQKLTMLWISEVFNLKDMTTISLRNETLIEIT